MVVLRNFLQIRFDDEGEVITIDLLFVTDGSTDVRKESCAPLSLYTPSLKMWYNKILRGFYKNIRIKII